MSEPDDIPHRIHSAQVLHFPAPKTRAESEAPWQQDEAAAEGSSAHPAQQRDASSPSSAASANRPRSGQARSSRSSASSSPQPANDEGPEGEPPRDLPQETGRRKRRGDNDDDLGLRLAFFPLTDLGNAERFAARNKGRVYFCAELGWLIWDRKRFSAHGAEEIVKRLEHECVRAIQLEAEALADSESGDYLCRPESRNKDGEVTKQAVFRSDLIAAWGRDSESAARMSAISKRAAAMLTIDVKQLDADPFKINVRNGTLVVRKREDGEDYVSLRPHDPADLITHLAPVDYDPKAEAPLFKKFLDEIQPPTEVELDRSADRDASQDRPKETKREVQRFLAQWFGYSLTGDIGEQKLVFFYGTGRNGKGVLVNLMREIAGDYAASIGIETFMDSGRARSSGQATPELAKLPGVRMLTTSEPKKGATIEDGLVKQLTGGDPIDARHLNKGYFAFVPQLKLTMQGNYRPKLPGTDEGIKGRVVLVPFGIFIPPERRDKHLGEKLKAEYSGVLNWMLDGLRDWLDHGLVQPGSVRAATEEYFADNDPLGRFLAHCTEQDMGHRVQSTEMHALFSAWAKANGETQWSPKGLAAAMKERGLASKKSDNVYWLDIKLTKRVGDFVDIDGNPIRHNTEDWER